MYSQGHTEDSDTGGQAGNIHKSLSSRDKIKNADLKVKLSHTHTQNENVIIVSSKSFR